MKYHAPQYELPAAAEVFNLAGELAADPDRLAVNRAAAALWHKQPRWQTGKE